jgi:hypothetical protein
MLRSCSPGPPDVPLNCGQLEPHGDNSDKTRPITTAEIEPSPRRDTEITVALIPTVVGATAVAALLLVAVADDAVGALDAIAHEAGHMVADAVTGTGSVTSR